MALEAMIYSTEGRISAEATAAVQDVAIAVGGTVGAVADRSHQETFLATQVGITRKSELRMIAVLVIVGRPAQTSCLFCSSQHPPAA